MNQVILTTLQQNTNLFKNYDLRYVGLFGSYARGDQNESSDVDLLVDFEKPKSFFDLANIQLTLQKILGKKIDLVTRKGLKKNLVPYIQNDIIPVYEKK